MPNHITINTGMFSIEPNGAHGCLVLINTIIIYKLDGIAPQYSVGPPRQKLLTWLEQSISSVRKTAVTLKPILQFKNSSGFKIPKAVDHNLS